MKKRLLTLAALAVLSVSLVGCNPNVGVTSNDSSTSTTIGGSSNSTTSSSTSSSASSEEEHTLSIEVTGDKVVDGSVTASIKFDDAPITSGVGTLTLIATTGADLVEIGEITASSAQISLKAAGSVTLEAKLVTNSKTYTQTTSFEIAPRPDTSISIAEAKQKAEDETVTVRGVVTAVSGKSAYIADSTGGMYIYNFSYDAGDTAITNGTWTEGDYVEVKANIDEYNGLKQLNNYTGDSQNPKVEGTYAYKLEDTNKPKPTYAPLDENGFKNLTAADAGNLYTFTATYVSGTPKTGTNVNVKFKIGNTDVILRTDKYDKVAIKYTLEVGRTYKISTPLSWYKGAQFAFLGTGTTLEDVSIEATSITLSTVTNTLGVGDNVPLIASFEPDDAFAKLTYESSDNEVATVENGKVIAKKVGTTKIKATYKNKNNEEINSNELDITVVDKATSVKINTLTNMDKYYVVDGIITAKTDYKFVISDETGSLVVNTNTTYNEGDFVTVKGVVNSSFHDLIQFNDVYNITKNEGRAPTLPEAVELTAEKANSFAEIKDANKTSNGIKYTWTTTFGKDGNYFLANIDGSNTKIEPANATSFEKDIVEGKKAKVEGYFVGWDNKYNYASFYFTSVTPIVDKVTINFDSTEANVNVNETLTLEPEVLLPEGKTDKSLTWESSVPSVATVENGVVKGIKVGETVITATSVADPTVSATITIKVIDPSTVQSISLTAENLGLAGYNNEEKSATVDGVSFSYLQLMKSNEGAIQSRNKGTSGALYNASSFSKAIKSITFNWSTQQTSSKPTAFINFATSAISTVQTTGSELKFVANETSTTINCSVENATYFRFDHNVSGTFYFSSIVINFVD